MYSWFSLHVFDINRITSNFYSYLFIMATSSFQAEQQTITLAITQRGGRAINNELRQRLIDAHQTGITYRQMERLYGVKRDTAYQVNARREKLLQICPNALAQITPSTCLNSFFHVLTVIVQKALRLEDL